MKTSLKYVVLSLVVALPTVATADSLGLILPTLMSPTHVFGALVATWALLTFVADYARQPRLAFRSTIQSCVAQSQPLSASHQSKYPLAA